MAKKGVYMLKKELVAQIMEMAREPCYYICSNNASPYGLLHFVTTASGAVITTYVV